MDISSIQTQISVALAKVTEWLVSPQFYAQCALILIAVLLAYTLGKWLLKNSSLLKQAPPGHSAFSIKQWLYRCRHLIIPVLCILTLAISAAISMAIVQTSWLVRIAQGIAVVVMCHCIISQLITSPFLKVFFKWTLIPLAVLHVFGWLTPTVEYLDSIAVSIGNIEFSAYGILRTLFFGFILFWIGRVSNNFGQQLIRQREELDIGTREIFAKLFEIFLLIIIFFILLQVMGINLTTLAVFGGALGVGLGFGLQAIASNFISGIILLLDRSLVIGDYIELEDGRAGTIRAMSMRCATLETFDGKDIVVPNETFITSSFTNWTHKDKKQRYSLEFNVAYKTDLHALFPILIETVSKHPQVISGDEVEAELRPDAEISGFGDSGVDILVEYWMEGIDDGKNRVDADLKLMIWDVLKDHLVEIPFPQREVRLVEK